MEETDNYRSIFSPSTATEREDNFESYWAFSQQHGGGLLEEDKDLEKKREKLRRFQDNPVRSKQPLPDTEAFYRNYIELKDDPKTMDRKTLLFTCIYKFARHEWVGILGAWDATPQMSDARSVRDKISRVHLAEEFCHGRLFLEMLRTFHLEDVEYAPLSPLMMRVYKLFPYLPGTILNPPAFITELMGLTFYHHLDTLFDDILSDEPEARDRLHELLHEIMVDELAHVGQRRNFIGPLGIKFAKAIVPPMYKMFFKDIPEAAYLFDVDKMIHDGLAFDYNKVLPRLLERSWVPSYCQPAIA